MHPSKYYPKNDGHSHSDLHGEGLLGASGGVSIGPIQFLESLKLVISHLVSWPLLDEGKGLLCRYRLQYMHVRVRQCVVEREPGNGARAGPPTRVVRVVGCDAGTRACPARRRIEDVGHVLGCRGRETTRTRGGGIKVRKGAWRQPRKPLRGCPRLEATRQISMSRSRDRVRLVKDAANLCQWSVSASTTVCRNADGRWKRRTAQGQTRGKQPQREPKRS